jgi:hypothetical protein
VTTLGDEAVTTSVPSHPGVVAGEEINPRLVRLLVGAAVVSGALGLLLLWQAEPASIGPLGLLDAIPGGVYPIIAVQAAAFATALRLPEQRTPLLVIPLIMIVALLHGAAPLVEPVARFPTAWIHSGFAEHILVHHSVLPELDGRFSWPGFFAAAATFTHAVGLEHPDQLLRWPPLLFNLAYLPPLLVLSRATLGGWRAPWLVLWVFTFINWVGQDYFAPQAAGLLLALCVLAVCVRWFSDPPAAAQPLTRRMDELIARAGEPPDVPATASTRLGLLVLVVGLSIALTVSHQLTPFVLAGSLLALWAARRLRPGALGVITALVAVGWLSLGAQTFWASHLSDIVDSPGDIGGVLTATLTDRIGGSPEHLGVLAVRLGFTALVWGGALVGLVRRVRQRGAVDVTVVVLAVTPFSLMLVQTYGGEGLLRLYLLSSPFVAALVARAFIPGERFSRLAADSLVIVSLVLAPVFYLARYGNEAFEQVTANELAVVRELYEHAPAGATIIAVSPQLPWRSRSIGDYEHLEADFAGHVGDPLPVLEGLASGRPGGSYIVITNGQLVFVERVLGQPPGWGEQLRTSLEVDPAFQAVFANDAGAIYRYDAGGEVR